MFNDLFYHTMIGTSTTVITETIVFICKFFGTDYTLVLRHHYILIMCTVSVYSQKIKESYLVTLCLSY